MPVRFPQRRQIVAVMLSIGLVGVGVSWAKVVQTIAEGKPAVSPSRPSAIVWANRVFDSRPALKRWLHSRGASYAAWEHRFPAAAAVLEHRRATAPSTVSTVLAARSARAHSQVRASRLSPSVDGGLRAATIALLLAVAAASALAAALPINVLRRSPAIARAVIPHRELLLTAAAALLLGLLVGVVLT